MIHKILLGQSFCASGHNLTFFEKYLPLGFLSSASWNNLRNSSTLLTAKWRILRPSGSTGSIGRSIYVEFHQNLTRTEKKSRKVNQSMQIQLFYINGNEKKNDTDIKCTYSHLSIIRPGLIIYNESEIGYLK